MSKAKSTWFEISNWHSDAKNWTPTKMEILVVNLLMRLRPDEYYLHVRKEVLFLLCNNLSLTCAKLWVYHDARPITSSLQVHLLNKFCLTVFRNNNSREEVLCYIQLVTKIYNIYSKDYSMRQRQFVIDRNFTQALFCQKCPTRFLIRKENDKICMERWEPR